MALLTRLNEAIFTPGGKRSKISPLCRSTVAACALACGDGRLTFAKRSKLDEVLQSLRRIDDFDVHAAVDMFEAFVADCGRDAAAGRQRALEAVAEIAGGTDRAQIVLRAAAAVAGIDGEPSEASRKRIEAIAGRLGLDVSQAQQTPVAPARTPGSGPAVIVLGNEKGGSGKSTVAIHLVAGLRQTGYRVASIDLDARQGTLSRFLDNRKAAYDAGRRDLRMPRHLRLGHSEALQRDEARREERSLLDDALQRAVGCDYVVIDTPGHDTYLSRLAHAYADTLVTPVNDSLLDIDVLAQIDRERRLVLAPSAYSDMVVQTMKRRVANDRPPLDWVVVRNRLAQLDTRNTREVARLLASLGERLGFRLGIGLSERVVFRELFFSGMTVLDLEAPQRGRADASQAHGRAEILELLELLGAPPAAAPGRAAAQVAPTA